MHCSYLSFSCSSFWYVTCFLYVDITYLGSSHFHNGLFTNYYTWTPPPPPQTFIAKFVFTQGIPKLFGQLPRFIDLAQNAYDMISKFSLENSFCRLLGNSWKILMTFGTWTPSQSKKIQSNLEKGQNQPHPVLKIAYKFLSMLKRFWGFFIQRTIHNSIFWLSKNSEFRHFQRKNLV